MQPQSASKRLIKQDWKRQQDSAYDHSGQQIGVGNKLEYCENQQASAYSTSVTEHYQTLLSKRSQRLHVTSTEHKGSPSHLDDAWLAKDSQTLLSYCINTETAKLTLVGRHQPR